MTNRLYYGDNLDVLRGFPDACVDLIYLDPPFNSNTSYNILFKSPAGKGADASIEAFGDTWTWGPEASSALMDVTQRGNHRLHTLLQAMKTAIGENAMMAYLAMMAVRLVELHRVLKPTGSLYLHCDPTASHYLKLVLDALMGADQFRSEIIWKRTSSHNSAKRWGPVHDVILFYSKSNEFCWRGGREEFDDEYLRKFYRFEDEGGRFRTGDLTGAGVRSGDSGKPWRGIDPTSSGRHWAVPVSAIKRAGINGTYLELSVQGKLDYLDSIGLIVWPARGVMPAFKRYLDQSAGTAIQDVVTDIGPLSKMAKERLGYPTQKPLALLERIISASSNTLEVVLDPFCGCGTAVDAAQKLGRKWIGIDITHLAIGLVEKRLNEGYNQDGKQGAVWETIGVPRDKASALRLAAEKPHDFQNWFCLQVGGYPLDGGRKGADKGVDGHFYPYESATQTATGVISVKAGQNIGVAMLRDLRGVMERDGHIWGLFLSAYEPTRPMLAEAAAAGVHENEFGRFARLQILTPADLFHGAGAKLPPLAPINRRAPRVETRASHKKGAQSSLL